MSRLIRNDDLRRLFIGAGGAVTAGLLVGAVMQPELNPEGMIPPQIALGESPHRDPPREGEIHLAAYGARVPDYVVGMDAVRMQRAAMQPVAYEPPPEPETRVPPETQPVAYDTPPADPPQDADETGLGAQVIDMTVVDPA